MVSGIRLMLLPVNSFAKVFLIMLVFGDLTLTPIF